MIRLRFSTLLAGFTLSTAAAQAPQETAPVSGYPSDATVASTSLDESRTVKRRLQSGSLSLGDDASISSSDESLRGFGRRYEILFGENEVDFQPMLGVQCPQAESIRFRLESIRRNDGVSLKAEQCVRLVENQTVRYRRADFDEIYEVSEDGVEQSFEFRRLPRGAGDLVVRMKLDTNMVPHTTEWTEGGVKMHLDGVLGHASIGRVIGIDANGVRAPGSMRCEGGVLELALPADFVESAALPLLLDPFITSSFEGSTEGTTFDQRDPDIAYDSQFQTYLIVWEREVSGVFQIRGRRVNRDGGPIGGFIAVNTTPQSKFNPRVAGVRTENAFVVAWSEGGDIRATGVGVDGAVYSAAGVDIAVTGDNEVAPAVGGEVSLDNEALVVWWNATDQRIEAKQVNVVGAPTDSVFAFATTVSISAQSGSTGPDSLPAISKSGGSTGYHLITWTREVFGTNQIRGQIVDRNLGVLDNFIAITNGPRASSVPACDGDGRNWVVAWERDEAGSTEVEDIFAVPVFLAPNNTTGVLGGPEVAIEDGVNDDEQRPVVSWLGESALIAFQDENSGVFDGTLVSVDPYTCQPFGNEVRVDVVVDRQSDLAIASEFSGGTNGDRALVGWDQGPVIGGGFVGEVRARLWQADAGAIVEFGGGCGNGGVAVASNITTGNSAFVHRLRGAAPNAACVLILGFGFLNGGCGPCTLVPDGAVFLNGTTDGTGNALIPMPLPDQPSLVGQFFIDQWVTIGTGCAGVYDFSTGILASIQ